MAITASPTHEGQTISTRVGFESSPPSLFNGFPRFGDDHVGTEVAVPSGPLNTVDKTQTIHRIINPAEERAVSMHVYSRPIDSCVVFDLEGQRCYRRDLKYDNE